MGREERVRRLARQERRRARDPDHERVERLVERRRAQLDRAQQRLGVRDRRRPGEDGRRGPRPAQRAEDASPNRIPARPRRRVAAASGRSARRLRARTGSRAAGPVNCGWLRTSETPKSGTRAAQRPLDARREPPALRAAGLEQRVRRRARAASRRRPRRAASPGRRAGRSPPRSRRRRGRSRRARARRGRAARRRGIPTRSGSAASCTTTRPWKRRASSGVTSARDLAVRLTRRASPPATRSVWSAGRDAELLERLGHRRDRERAADRRARSGSGSAGGSTTIVARPPARRAPRAARRRAESAAPRGSRPRRPSRGRAAAAAGRARRRAPTRRRAACRRGAGRAARADSTSEVRG